MKITMTVGQEGPDVSRVRGDELDLDDAEAGRLIDAAFAVEGWASEAAAAPVAKPAASKPAAKKAG